MSENENVAPVALSKELQLLEPQIEKVLPPHVSVDRFMRVVLSAIARNDDLRTAHRPSLLTACVTCATDGLVPDGREAALVVYNTNARKKVGNHWVDNWIAQVQYMPMVFGILKLIRQSGEIKSFACDAVYTEDHFRYWTDDDGAHIEHEPRIPKSARGDNLGAFAMFTTHDGGRFIEFVDRDDLETIRSKSKSAFDRNGKLKDTGPWAEFSDEMRIKSAIHRLFKRAPVSTEIDRTIRRLDEHYTIEGEAERVESAPLTGNARARAALGVIPPNTIPGANTIPTTDKTADPVPAASDDADKPPVKTPVKTMEKPQDETAPWVMSQAEVANMVDMLQKCRTVEQVERILSAVPGDESTWPLAIAAKADEMREHLSKQ